MFPSTCSKLLTAEPRFYAPPKRWQQTLGTGLDQALTNMQRAENGYVPAPTPRLPRSKPAPDSSRSVAFFLPLQPIPLSDAVDHMCGPWVAYTQTPRHLVSCMKRPMIAHRLSVAETIEIKPFDEQMVRDSAITGGSWYGQ